MGTETSFAYLTKQEVLFLDAAVARLIPSDDLGPGAKEAGVTSFIDRQLAGAWGAHGRNYRMGPWLDGTPQQGFQSPLTPQEMYRAAISEINSYCNAQHGKVFHLLDHDQQNQLLKAMERAEFEIESIRSDVFFGILFRNTVEGYFSDPVHGGNRDKIGWRLIGFPGVASAAYAAELNKHNEGYLVEPVSILDMEQEQVRTDAQGYPIHISQQGRT